MSSTSIATQLRARSPKISYLSDHICRGKQVKALENERNAVKMAILIPLHPGIPQDIPKSRFEKLVSYYALLIFIVYNA